MTQYSLVLLAVIGQDEVFELHLHLDPLLVGERGPDVMRLGDRGLVGFQDHFGAVVVDVERPEDQDETGEGLESGGAKQTLFTRGMSRCGDLLSAMRLIPLLRGRAILTVYDEMVLSQSS